MLSLFRQFKKTGESYTAIDIGTGEIKLAEIKVHGRSTLINSLRRIPTPEETFNGNNTIEKLSSAIKELVESGGLTCKEVITCIGGGHVTTRNIFMPMMPAKEIDRAIIWEAEKYISLPSKDVVLRYVVLGEIDLFGNRQLNIMMIAAPKDIVYRHLEIFARAGLEVKAIDIHSFALWRVFSRETPAGDTIAVIDIGRKTSHLVILEKSHIRDVKNLSFGGTALSTHTSIPNDVKNFYGEGNKHTLRMTEAAGDTAEKAAEEVLGLRDFCIEVKKSLDSYRLQNQRSMVKKIVITGGTSKFKGIQTYLSEKLELPVELGIPDLPVSEKSGITLPVDPVFSLAVGLALREVPAKCIR